MSAVSRIKMTRTTYERMRQALLTPCGREHKLYAELRTTTGGYLVRKLWVPEDADYICRTPTFVHLSPLFMLRTLLAYADSDADGVLEVHSHPFARKGIPSQVDDAYIDGVREDFDRRKPGAAFLRMVVAKDEDGFTLEVFDPETGWFTQLDEIVIVGDRGVEHLRSFRSPADPSSAGPRPGYERLAGVRTLDEQERMRAARGVVVGAGGTGWLATQFLLCLGVGALTLVDGDRVEIVNLNRLVGVTRDEVERGAPKVDCLGRMARDQDPDRPVTLISERFPNERAVEAIAAADFVVCCVDDPLGRFDVLRLCVRHLVPALDIGSSIYLNDDRSREAERHAHAWLYRPGLASCWLQMGLREQGLADEGLRETRRAVGYVDGDTREAPGSVQTLNAAIVSQGLTLLEAYLLGRRPSVDVVLYEERHEPKLSVSLRQFATASDAECPLCGEDGFAGAGGNPFAPAAAVSDPIAPATMGDLVDEEQVSFEAMESQRDDGRDGQCAQT